MKTYRLLFLLLLILFFNHVYANIRLPQLINSGMVLQRDQKIKIWGWAGAGEKIEITFLRKHYHAVADTNGKWLSLLAKATAGGPYSMDIAGNNRIHLTDILIGDVWFCSGQSNMVLQMERVKEKYPVDIAQANFPEIRNFFVPTLSGVSQGHPDLPPSKWIAANPTTVLDFGAASYFFARQLYFKYHVPIGIINSSVGGTPIQAWISAEGIKQLPDYVARLVQLYDTAYTNKIQRLIIADREKPLPHIYPDKGLTEALKWYDVNYGPIGWKPFWLPGYWADQGIRGLNGVVWFRKEIILPDSMAGKPAKLFLGRIVDADEAYVNGVKVGNITYQYPPRRYEIPAGVLHAGKNLIVVRVTNYFGKGGFVPDKNYSLVHGNTRTDLRGDWQYKVGQVFMPKPVSQNIPTGIVAQNEPTGLYNTMVAPATNYTIKGFLWYQGEANTDNPKEYAQLLPALITDWRNKWQNQNLPFIYVQLPNFMEEQYSPSESQWAQLREAQLKTLSVPLTGMAVTIDAGEWNDIHPVNKQVVGYRLALAAERIAYGDSSIVAFGPIYRSAKIDGNKIIISFTSTGNGLMVKGGGELSQFAIAGADKKFFWAAAKIAGGLVIVSSDEVPNPVYVRYAWADNPDGANLYNKEGLPASPFSTE
jgi:sialate O-acetylesterase